MIFKMLHYILIILLIIIIVYLIRNTFLIDKEEYFALSGTFITDVSKIIPSKYYKIGKRTVSSTQTPAVSGGKTCVEYPDVVYIEQPIVDAVCKGENIDSNYDIKDSPIVTGRDLLSTWFSNYPLNNSIVSPNGKYMIVFQNDGNLVYKSDYGNRGVWDAQTNGRGKSLAFQADGNLVVRDGNGVNLWDSNTARTVTQADGPFRLQIKDDGNVVLYKRDGADVWNAIWERQFGRRSGDGL